jgi:hypothetical protein
MRGHDAFTRIYSYSEDDALLDRPERCLFTR